MSPEEKLTDFVDIRIYLSGKDDDYSGRDRKYHCCYTGRGCSTKKRKAMEGCNWIADMGGVVTGEEEV